MTSGEVRSLTSCSVYGYSSAYRTILIDIKLCTQTHTDIQTHIHTVSRLQGTPYEKAVLHLVMGNDTFVGLNDLHNGKGELHRLGRGGYTTLYYVKGHAFAACALEHIPC